MCTFEIYFEVRSENTLPFSEVSLALKGFVPTRLPQTLLFLVAPVFSPPTPNIPGTGAGTSIQMHCWEWPNSNMCLTLPPPPCSQVDSEMNTLLMRLPNLLDSRVPDGDGEKDNVVVSEWGQEYIHSGEVRLTVCPTEVRPYRDKVDMCNIHCGSAGNMNAHTYVYTCVYGMIWGSPVDAVR